MENEASEVEELASSSVETPDNSWQIPKSLRALRHRNYRLYFFGQLVSMTGSWMQTTALAWVVYHATGETKWPAYIATAQILPTFLFGAWAGVLADRMSKRKLIFATQAAALVQALILLAFVGAGVTEPWILVAVTALGGLIQAVDFPARLAFVIEMASREDLVNAVALNSLIFNVARIIGPAVSGALLLWRGPDLCFLLNAASYLAVLWALSQMELAPASQRPPVGPVGLRSLFGGFEYLARNRSLALLVVLIATTSCAGWPFTALLPAISVQRFAMAEQGYSWLLSATGLGSLIGAALVASFGSLERKRRFIVGGVVTVTAGLLGLSAAPTIPAAVFCCAMCGSGLIMFLATCQSVLQLSTDDHFRSQVMGVYAMILSGAVPLGNQIAGPAADKFGERVVLVCQGLACGAAAACVFLLARVLRKRSRQG